MKNVAVAYENSQNAISLCFLLKTSLLQEGWWW